MYLYELKDFLERKINSHNLYVTSCDRLPSNIKLPSFFIINLSPSTSPGTHWVALTIDVDGIAYYFDSYGFKPENPMIRSFIKMHSKRFEYCHRQLQQLQSRVCGKYAALFLYYWERGCSMNDFLKKFSCNLVLNDALVEKMYDYVQKK